MVRNSMSQLSASIGATKMVNQYLIILLFMSKNMTHEWGLSVMRAIHVTSLVINGDGMFGNITLEIQIAEISHNAHWNDNKFDKKLMRDRRCHIMHILGTHVRFLTLIFGFFFCIQYNNLYLYTKFICTTLVN